MTKEKGLNLKTKNWNVQKRNEKKMATLYKLRIADEKNRCDNYTRRQKQ